MPAFALQVIDRAVIVEVPTTCSNLELPDYQELDRKIETVLSRLGEPPIVVFDFSKTQFFGTLMLESVLRARKLCESKGGQVAVAGLHAPIEELFRLAHLDELIPSFASVREALDQLETRRSEN